MMRSLGIGLLLTMVGLLATGQTPPAIRTGPAVGSPVPVFSAPDQNGVVRTSASLLGPKGGLLVFFRSADW